MAVHVIIKRKFRITQPEKLIPLLNELSDRAKVQSGYLSTETLQSLDNPDECMVVSKWESVSDWEKWFLSRERKEIQDKVDSLIGERTFYELFQPLT